MRTEIIFRQICTVFRVRKLVISKCNYTKMNSILYHLMEHAWCADFKGEPYISTPMLAFCSRLT